MKAHLLSDSELLGNFLNGDNAALEVLIKRHQQKVFTAVYVMVRDRYLAEDLFQEIIIKAIQKLRTREYNEEGKFLSWLLRIAHNHCIDYFRRVRNAPGLKVTTSTGEDIFKFIGVEDTPVEKHKEIESKENRLKRLIDKLPADQREVVILRHYYDYSFKEIAAHTNVSINTALGRMRYALINLRKMIEREKVDILF
ncbi:MAG: sigma-70 family RNA polymerase sigma factor [Chitinophagales bacterium]|nr:sigma-70 family RNA polymerase sigma factor [Chitinophagales bacterium]MDW8274133.1 sigma-70 family RNA polymerase sigma factor [Chitinophagales bacterium]